jgi:hypothetical protein
MQLRKNGRKCFRRDKVRKETSWDFPYFARKKSLENGQIVEKCKMEERGEWKKWIL